MPHGRGRGRAQRGFDHWIIFRRQGQYFAKGPGALNIDGRRSPQPGYVTDDPTDFAADWISQRKEEPFFLYLSHKAVHADFVPADRHKGRYQDQEIKLPGSHSALDAKEYYKCYCETMLAVDDSVGRVLAQLEKNGVLDSTLVVVMGDNGFLLGEHGLIDKRNACEEFMRVPLVMRYPARFKAGTSVSQVVANIDIAPTLLAVAGLPVLPVMQATSFLPLARGERFKYIRYQGLRDIDELYDIQADPAEMNNLINDPAHAETVCKMNGQLFKTLAETDGLKIPLRQDRGSQMNKRRDNGSAPGGSDKTLVE